MPRIIVFNTGSSSLKFKLFNFHKVDKKLILEKQGEVEGIGLIGGPKNHRIAIDILFEGVGRLGGFLKDIPDLAAIGHRVVHCGDIYSKTTKIDQSVIDNLKKFSLNAPLHNPKIIEVIETIQSQSGRSGHRDIPNFAVFDSVYFKDLPKVTKIYPLPYYLYEDYGIKRYGFHGISHQANVQNVTDEFGKSIKKIISLHLGEGSSIAAILDGHPIDTSMGFTPLEGLMMMTRSGDIDSGIIHWLIERKIITHTDVDKMLNFDSGLQGVAGIKCGMKDILNIAGYKVEDADFKPTIHPSNVEFRVKERTQLAIEMYVYRIKKYIGAYYSILGGLDALVFSGRIGYGSSEIRKMVTNGLDHILKKSHVLAISSEEEKQIAREIIPYI